MTAVIGTTGIFGNGQANANPSTGDTPHILEVINDNDPTHEGVRITTYGAPAAVGGQNNFHWDRGRGTEAAPTPVLSGDFLMSMGYRASFDASGVMSQSSAAFQCLATEDWSTTAQGAAFQWQVTPAGQPATARAQAMYLDGNGLGVLNRLGCGIQSPTYQLHVVASAGAANVFAVQDDTNTGLFYSVAGANGGISAGESSAMAVAAFRKISATGRSINAAGTVNASGADYAEYMRKAPGCGNIAKGQVAGVDANGELTDKWADAISFLVKSTNPSYVGGDTHGSEEALGMARPEYRTDADWPEFERRLESARQSVDRMAFAGQVPVNVLGAMVGDYIVPAQPSDGAISAVPLSADTISFSEYRLAVGKVIAIEADGRARIIVKVA